MPFYEYECPSCRYYAEVLQKISDKPLKKCPSCGKAGFKRLVSAPVFRLKGSGWYETDFKSDKEGQRNLAATERDQAPAPDTKAKSDDQAGATKVEPAAKPDKDKPSSAGAEAGKSSRSGAKPAAKSPTRRSVKRPARSARRGRGRR